MMTNREFYNAIINGKVTADIVAKATEELSKLDAKNAKRASDKSAKRVVEFTPIEDSILEILSDGQIRITSEIASMLSLNPSKVSPRCKALVEKGKVSEVDVKVPKVGMRKGYVIIK